MDVKDVRATSQRFQDRIVDGVAELAKVAYVARSHRVAYRLAVTSCRTFTVA